MSRPLISIIMPCYNAEAYIEQTVINVFEQTYGNVELIVVDDGSTDNSPALLTKSAQNFPGLTILHQPNKGPYPARNLALQHAKGEYIALLDADDYWSVDCLEKLYSALVSANADVSYCGWQNIVENGQDGPQYVPPAYEQGNIHEAFLTGCPWPIHAALTRKSIVDQVGGFSERRFSAMDYDFWIRISAVTQNIVLVPEVLAFYRWHQHGQISSVKWRQVLDAWQVRKDFVAQNPSLFNQLQPSSLSEFINGPVLKQAIEAFWKRDLLSAQKLFRAILSTSSWQTRDLKYLLPALLPLGLYRQVVSLLEKS
ncbi:MAG: glycosyltransferase [Methylococcaceae bacterium]|nr:glycosyltransferase [Methylococcaceae bacterium]MDZ4156126.1 glycosyltransferase [Methylococcales bacterium]MDP2393705.1 glycosyltransferase [Methylococcaceae bacterium]MDP3019731.1 glycosyltransferase [Methylococcaceae bacterium]MDP3390199.1 glycosyltransferase [Methylococcaceae bacterium]